MKIKTVKLHNFRGYKDISIDFDDLTAFVGKNDIGKSTILEALDIFFNESKGVIKLEPSDLNIEAKQNDDKSLSIGVEFTDLPDTVILDATANTTFAEEHMLNSRGYLEIIKRFPTTSKAVMSIRAEQPIMPNGEILINLTNKELKSIVEKEHIPCENRASNPLLRHAIWDAMGEGAKKEEVEIELNSTDGKKIAESVQKLLPAYALFQSDRSNTESDKEIQDPLKTSVARLIKEGGLEDKLNDIAQNVHKCLKDVADNTLAKLNELDPSLADSIKPVLPDTNTLKWADVFKNVSIAGEDGIPINKRGSGLRRMILLSFFRAEAERVAQEKGGQGMIYAIEEPETSQHGSYQKLLIESLKSLACQGCQIIITTHSSQVVKSLKFSQVRLVMNDNGSRTVKSVEEDLLPIPSLNEVNYLAFGEISEEYHIELYSYIDSMGYLNELSKGLQTYQYIRLYSKKGTTELQQLCLPTKLRHMMHHKENKHNGNYTPEQLRESIEIMRSFLARKKQEVI